MNAGDPTNPFDFGVELGEKVTITVRPTAVGNTFVVSAPAKLVSDGKLDSDETVFEFVVDRPSGTGQVIACLFRFPEASPAGGFTHATWPRYEVEVKGDGTPEKFTLPAVLQSSSATTATEREINLLFVTS